MKIDEAIFNNVNAANHLEVEGLEDWANSVKLGNEALKLIQDIRKQRKPGYTYQLPGETEE